MFYEMIGFVAEGHDPALDCLPVFETRDAAFFLDFDGVLVGLAETPSAIEVRPEVPEILAELHERAGGAVAIVSGRAIDDIKRFLPGFPGTIVGSHGAEIDRGPGSQRPGAERMVNPDPARVEALRKMVEGFAVTDPRLHRRAQAHRGRGSTSARKPELRGAAYHMLEAALQDFDGFHIHHSKMAFEVRPDGVGKENAVEALMREVPLRGAPPRLLRRRRDRRARARMGARPGGASRSRSATAPPPRAAASTRPRTCMPPFCASSPASPRGPSRAPPTRPPAPAPGRASRTAEEDR